MTRALITGVTGQDGSYLAELLLDKGYAVYGLVRRTSDARRERISHLDALRRVEGDVLDQGSLVRAMEEARPDEIYNLAAQSFVGRSWKEPVHTADVTGLGALRVFEAARMVCPRARIYQASTSEMYGNSLTGGQPARPEGPFRPRSPYGSAKLFAHSTAILFRESFGLHISCGILFNHESPRRGPEFVTRKVCRGAVAAARTGQKLGLGNLDVSRDWGWAPDYVDAMWRMLQQDEPGDYVCATGVSHSLQELCEIAFDQVGLDWRDFVVVDPAFVRPAEVYTLVGDPSEAERVLGWERKVDFEQMVRRMVDAELS